MKISFDTETRGLDWWDPDEQAFLGSWADADGQYHEVLPTAGGEFEGTLTHADVILAHNLAFDIHQTRETLGYDVLASGAELHDTDLLARVVHPELRQEGVGYGLKPLAKVFVDPNAMDAEDAIKEMGKAIGLRTMRQKGAYYQVWRAYPDVMERYAREDARITYDLFECLHPKLKDPGLKRIYELEMAVLPVLVRAEQRGMRIDQAAVDRLKAEYEPQLAEAREYLIAELGEQALSGEGSTEALTEALLAVGVPLSERTRTGQIATNKFALQKFAADFPVIAKLEEFRTLSRFLDTYVGAVDDRASVHCSFRQFEAWTGRMSCTRPNMQNWPKRAGKEVRSVFIPREGHSFVVCDYESIEERLLAYYLNDPGYIELSVSRDPHAWMAAQIWGGELSSYLKGTAGEEQRGLAKNIKYAISYGAGKRRVANMLADAGMPCSDDDAREIISKIKASLPGWWHLQKRIKDKIARDGYVSTLFGRKNVVNRDKAYVGLNALIQGSAADICKLGLVNVDDAVKPLGGIPLLVVHDEIVVEVPSEHADECRRRMMLAMCDLGDVHLSPALSVSGSVVTTSYADA